MKTMLVSDFKSHCVGILNEVHDHGLEVVVTKRGRPLARIVPAASGASGSREPGDCIGTVRVMGDLVSTDGTDDWENLRE